jgi:hypothetical protein
MKETTQIKGFGDRLLDQERPDPVYRQRYERQVQAMLEKRLSPIARIGFAALALLGVWATVEFCHYGLKHSNSYDILFLLRVVFLPAAFVSAVWTCLTGWVAVTGRLHLRSQRPYLAPIGLALAFYLAVTMMFIFVVPISREQGQSGLGTQLALMAFSFVITLGLCITIAVIHRGQCATQERLLQIEYRIADLAERMENRDEGEGQGAAV